jgi:oxygen-independent coproporphyrinogen-3 oxidase
MPQPQPPPAARRLQRLWTAVGQKVGAIDQLEVHEEGAGARARLRFAGRPLDVAVVPGDAPGAPIREGGWSWVLKEGSALPLGPGAEAALRAVARAFAKEAQPAAAAPVAPGPAAPERPAPTAAEVAAARARLADQLHFASYVARQAIIHDDLYPHVGTLGEPVGTEALHAAWAETAARIRAGAAPPLLGLYVHIPFCAVACSFCYCSKTDRFTRGGVETYLDQLLAEARALAPLLDGLRFKSVYVGGGTPSILPVADMERLFDTLYSCFHVPAGTQVIVEGNPDSLTEQKVRVIAEKGRATRLTLGVQTLDPEVQARFRRRNKPEQVAAAVAAARRYGVPHVNVDLMAGLEGQTMASFQRDLEFLASLRTDSVHLNAFRTLPGIRYSEAGGRLSTDQEALRDEMMAWGKARLAQDPMVRTEARGFEGPADVDNLQEYDLRRQNSSLVGLGYPSRSHSFGGFYYLPDLSPGMQAGLDAELSGQPRRWRAVRADLQEERHKYLVSNLRSGFSRAEYAGLFGTDPLDDLPEAFEDLHQLGLLRQRGDRVWTRPMDTAEAITARVLLYSPAQLERAREVWGPGYDRGAGYAAELQRLCGA